MAARFVHLNCHSAFSLLEGALPIAAIVKLAKRFEMPAVGLADTANLFGALEFSEKAAASGIQPIVGIKLPIAFGPLSGRQRNGRSAVALLTLLAANEEGWSRLSHLASRYHMAPDAEPALPLDALAGALAEPSLIALTGGHDGLLYPLLAAGEGSLAEERLTALLRLFGDRLYVSVERHGLGVERSAEAGVVGLAYALDLPLVATNEPYFETEGHFEAHDALLAIAEGRRLSEDDRRRLTPDHHFASPADMAARFRDLPEALDNTLEVAMRCSVRPRTVAPMLPRFIEAPDAEAREAEELRAEARAGLEARLGAITLAEGFSAEDYRRRLDMELDVIAGMKFPGYFLIVADFIKWAKGKGIPVGPGRGSGAGSMVAYALTITDLDPLAFGLLFERFLNPDRVSMPDFDIDFCQERRDEVIAYVAERYGRDRVAGIITFGSLQARAVLRDVGRVLEMPFGLVDQLCKLVPIVPANPVTLAQAIEGDSRFAEAREREPVVGQLLDISLKLEGLYRHASTHAAGIVIGTTTLVDLVPMYRDPRSSLPVTQYNMKWVEQAGLVKFDFLGLKTLTVISEAVKLVRETGVALDIATIPLDDAKTYGMLSRGEVVGVFQVESAGMRRALVGMKPDRLTDIIALVALYRPGPMDNIPTFNRRKHGEEKVETLHPLLEPILKETYGVIIYQEQVMEIARSLSGYSLGEADLLRRAMGKKIKSEMDAQRARFVEGAVANKVGKADASAIFDLVAKFASYGFNKSHAAAYALLTYQTAWLKANHSTAFLAASMALDSDRTDKLAEFRLEAARLGIVVVPPDVNRSGASFEVEDGHILYALSALKGVGEGVARHIVEMRGGRPFASLSDFAHRIDPKIVGRRPLECLVQAGAFDGIEPDRARVFATIPKIVAAAQERVERKASGVFDMFAADSGPTAVALAEAEPWAPMDRMAREFAAIGAYLSAHPLDDYQGLVEKRGGSTWAAFAEKVRSHGVEAGLVAGTLVSRRDVRTRNGGRMGILTLSDPTGQFEATVYQERMHEWRDLLEPGQSLLLEVAADYDAETEEMRVRVNAVERLEERAAKARARLRVVIDRHESVERVRERLAGKGEGSVALVLMLPDRRRVEVRLKGTYAVTPQVAGALRAVPGVVSVDMLQ